jgi:signal recognition particle subunit SRP54
MKMMKELQSGMMQNPNGLAKKKGSSGKRLTPKERAKLKKEREKEMRNRKRDQRRGGSDDAGDDGDARGGAALSVKQVTGVPIKFIGTGEHLDALEEFHPDRMAGRILGQGDLLTLVEKAQREFDQDEMLRQEERLKKGEFTLDDFRSQLKQIGRMGPLQKVMGLIPGMSAMSDMMGDIDPEKDMKRLFGIIDAMTPAERRTPSKTIDQSRRRRIAAGAGVAPHEVNDLVKQFDAMAQMMTALAGKGMRERMKMMKELQSGMMQNPNGLAKKKGSSGKRLTPKERARLKKEREKEMRKRKRDQRRGGSDDAGGDGDSE